MKFINDVRPSFCAFGNCVVTNTEALPTHCIGAPSVIPFFLVSDLIANDLMANAVFSNNATQLRISFVYISHCSPLLTLRVSVQNKVYCVMRVCFTQLVFELYDLGI